MEFLTGAVQKEDLGIAEILAGDYEGKNIKVKGAIHTIRDMGEVASVSYTHLTLPTKRIVEI